MLLNEVESSVKQAVTLLQNQLGASFKPVIMLTLGSGLDRLSDQIDVVYESSYDQIPGFMVSSVEGHEGFLRFGFLKGVPVAVMRGRAHLYEGTDPKRIAIPFYVMQQLGVKMVLLTNASGSLNPEVLPGQLSVICDHLNFQIPNPLIGQNFKAMGPRFLPMENAYDQSLRQLALDKAKEIGVSLHQGIYMGVMGPMYETPAEIRAYRLLGADLIGMSTTSDVIAARHCGLKVLAIASVTNLASGLSEDHLGHEQVIDNAQLASTKLIHLIDAMVEALHEHCR